MRKDIECCYGTVKGRLRLFKAGILYKTRDSIDNACFTACILHNMLHHYDKLDVMTEATGWQGSAGPLGGGEPDVGTGDDNDSETPSPGFEEFRAKLVTQFSVAWTRKEVVWFQRAAV
ncbi:unnamed protein product [Ectocarpus sp. CCAP 1310/34]|nr:unnamed protein product [Ectocarpus sp. CCAP 1310/34]